MITNRKFQLPGAAEGKYLLARLPVKTGSIVLRISPWRGFWLIALALIVAAVAGGCGSKEAAALRFESDGRWDDINRFIDGKDFAAAAIAVNSNTRVSASLRLLGVNNPGAACVIGYPKNRPDLVTVAVTTAPTRTLGFVVTTAGDYVTAFDGVSPYGPDWPVTRCELEATTGALWVHGVATTYPDSLVARIRGQLKSPLDILNSRGVGERALRILRDADATRALCVLTSFPSGVVFEVQVLRSPNGTQGWIRATATGARVMVSGSTRGTLPASDVSVAADPPVDCAIGRSGRIELRGWIKRPNDLAALPNVSASSSAPTSRRVDTTGSTTIAGDYQGWAGAAVDAPKHSFSGGDGFVELFLVDTVGPYPKSYEVCWIGPSRRCWTSRTTSTSPDVIRAPEPPAVGTYNVQWSVEGVVVASWKFTFVSEGD